MKNFEFNLTANVGDKVWVLKPVFPTDYSRENGFVTFELYEGKINRIGCSTGCNVTMHSSTINGKCDAVQELFFKDLKKCLSLKNILENTIIRDCHWYEDYMEVAKDYIRYPYKLTYNYGENEEIPNIQGDTFITKRILGFLPEKEYFHTHLQGYLMANDKRGYHPQEHELPRKIEYIITENI